VNASRTADPRIAFFDRLAPCWDQDCSHPGQTLRRLAALKQKLGLAPGQDLLEVGCGTGQITGWLLQAVAPGRVVALDFSPGMLAQARRRNAAAEFHRADICSGQLRLGRFDIALCFNAFPHFRHMPAALRHLARSLKRAGRLLILHLMGSAELNAFHQRLHDPVCRDLLPSTDEWPALLESSGLRLDSLVDQADLFLLKAVSALPHGRPRGRCLD
jgi:ubiquinone/menaquinone biosynthesis C-methylase UbiE